MVTGNLDKSTFENGAAKNIWSGFKSMIEQWVLFSNKKE
jgi:hypothetical protein